MKKIILISILLGSITMAHALPKANYRCVVDTATRVAVKDAKFSEESSAIAKVILNYGDKVTLRICPLSSSCSAYTYALQVSKPGGFAQTFSSDRYSLRISNNLTFMLTSVSWVIRTGRCSLM